ncbi:hypothetical protein GALL_507310 [mine drainage metagenome]|uniref:Uncharacterized protein n=1 Tax=mine drainage metagenome TaxID=410659 RepID=A0A1J5PQY4_9ZZZZ
MVPVSLQVIVEQTFDGLTEMTTQVVPLVNGQEGRCELSQAAGAPIQPEPVNHDGGGR